jgi:hypothetical protein
MSAIRDSHCYTGINVVALDAEVGMLDRRERVHDRFSCSGLVFLYAKKTTRQPVPRSAFKYLKAFPPIPCLPHRQAMVSTLPIYHDSVLQFHQLLFKTA